MPSRSPGVSLFEVIEALMRTEELFLAAERIPEPPATTEAAPATFQTGRTCCLAG